MAARKHIVYLFKLDYSGDLLLPAVSSSAMFHQSSLFLIALLFLFSFFRFLGRAWHDKSTANQPPSPPGLPLIGNLRQLGSEPHRSLQALAKKYGPVMLLRLGRVPVVVISSPAAAREVMKTRDLSFASRPDSSIADRFFYRSQDIAFGKYGEQWRQMRRIAVLHLLSQRQVLAFGKVREEGAAILVAKIRAAAGPVNLSDMIIDFTNDLICRVALGRTYADSKRGGSELLALFSEFVELMGEFPVRDYVPWLGWIDRLTGLDGRVRKTARELDALLEKVVAEHRLRKNRETVDGDDMDLVDILFSVGDEDASSTNFSLSMDNIKGIIMDLIAAGTDPMHATIEWAMAELIKHPRMLARAQEEIRRVVGSDGGIREEKLEGAEYLKAVIKETLRLYPSGPVPIPRESMEDAEIQGYRVRKGARVILNVWAIGRNPEWWERAEEFSPERFLNNNNDDDNSPGVPDFKGSDFRYIPFGAGRRGCPGIGFAAITMEVMLANLLYHFDWEMPGGVNSDEMNMEEVCGLVAKKKSSLILVAKPFK